MTGYHIKHGYSYNNKDLTKELILEIARGISLIGLRNKAIEYGVLETDGLYYLQDYIDSYKQIPSKDATTTLIDKEDDLQLMQLASAGGKSREMKEVVRKAFSILFIDECFRRGIAVSLVMA